MRTRGWIALVVLVPLLFTCEKTEAPSPAPRVTPVQKSDLVLVVALFRHGVRAPTKSFATKDAAEHSKREWPSLKDWCVADPCSNVTDDNWGDLTMNARGIARRLGRYYADTYKKDFGGPFTVRFWADTDQRTRVTAGSLVDGFNDGGVSDARCDSLVPGCDSRKTDKSDLLFHPFKGLCGTPDRDTLQNTANAINKQWDQFIDQYRSQLNDLYKVLGCDTPASCKFDHPEPASICAPVRTDCDSPIRWQKNQISYASSATEAFLLEYANNMSPVGWGYVQPEGNLKTLLQLHELYFDQTERKVVNGVPYVAKIDGSNLVLEIRDIINRKIEPLWTGCPHAPREAQFVGLLGHDTNLASLNALLKLGWKFDDWRLSPDTNGLPANDALPAGALVFELRKDPKGKYFISAYYVTQTLREMQKGTDQGIYRLAVQGEFCKKNSKPCEITLLDFNELTSAAIKPGEFVYHCEANKQQCVHR